MNEEQISRIVKESIQAPSNTFTDEVMKKVEMEPVDVQKSRRVIILLSIACILCFLLVIMISFPDFTFLNYRIDISPLFIQVPAIIFIVYEIRQIREIHRNVEYFKGMEAT